MMEKGPFCQGASYPALTRRNPEISPQMLGLQASFPEFNPSILILDVLETFSHSQLLGCLIAS